MPERMTATTASMSVSSITGRADGMGLAMGDLLSDVVDLSQAS